MTVEPLYETEMNKNEAKRIAWVTELAAISRGKRKSSNPSQRYGALLTEAEGGLPSRPVEYLPVELNYSFLQRLKRDQIQHLSRFGHWYQKDINSSFILRTNMRAVLSAGIKYNYVPYNKNISDYYAFRIKAPMFVWAQITTHTQLTTEAQSDRIVSNDEYWIPRDLPSKMRQCYGSTYEENSSLSWFHYDLADEQIRSQFIFWMTNVASQAAVQAFLKKLGYPKEIYSRFPYYAKMKEFVIGGWASDYLAWGHFLFERNAFINLGVKNWTQPETARIARLIRSHINVSDEEFSFMRTLFLSMTERNKK